MKKIIPSISLLILVLSVSSCRKDLVNGTGPLVTQNRPISNFHGVSYAVPGNLNFSTGPVFKVEVIAQQNILDIMETRIVNGILKIEFQNDKWVRSHENITVNITAPSADYIALSGTGDINASGNLVSTDLELTISGTGNITVQQATVSNKIFATISGTGDIKVNSGSADKLEVRTAGTGDADLLNVPALHAETHTSGSGDIRLNVSQTLDVEIAGNGSVYYRGNPIISTRIAGSGVVRHI
jgi:hypothetical protein